MRGAGLGIEADGDRVAKHVRRAQHATTPARESGALGTPVLCPFYNGVGFVKRHEGWGELWGSSVFLPQDLFCAADQGSRPRILRWFLLPPAIYAVADFRP
jgi:hypothetical protein